LLCDFILVFAYFGTSFKLIHILLSEKYSERIVHMRMTPRGSKHVV
jgi:hypothetical protein